jgi:hypothetical protein
MSDHKLELWIKIITIRELIFSSNQIDIIKGENYKINASIFKYQIKKRQMKRGKKKKIK